MHVYFKASDSCVELREALGGTLGWDCPLEAPDGSRDGCGVKARSGETDERR